MLSLNSQRVFDYWISPLAAGKPITVVVYFDDDRGHTEWVTSDTTEAIAATVPDAPRGLTISSGDTGALNVTWEAPTWLVPDGILPDPRPVGDGGSPVTGYKVQWKEVTGSWEVEADVSEATVTGTAHTINDLTVGTEYAVRVLATNAVGDGVASE